jgi:tRNA (guanine10-N2)-dimethyltransferase
MSSINFIKPADNTDACIALCTRIPSNELVSAECTALTGSLPEADGVALCSSVDHVKRAAYIRTGLNLLAHAHTLDDLVNILLPLEFPADQFRLDFVNLSDHNKITRQQAILAVANSIKAYPNLDHPKDRFTIVNRQDEIMFGKVAIEADHSYQIHETKPWHTSSSLPVRLARAMVNLAGIEVRSIIDPCCGSGSILLEACLLGLEAFGMDINTRMVGMTRKNLAHFGYQAEVLQGDARECEITADAVVTDLPYGLYSHTSYENMYGILKQAVQYAPLGIFAVGEDLTPLLLEAGYKKVEVFRIKKRREMTRFILRAM